jgi:hypothetical protein
MKRELALGSMPTMGIYRIGQVDNKSVGAEVAGEEI